MEPRHHYIPYYLNANPLPEGSGGERDRERDRFPQWTHAETKEFLAVRAELDGSFMKTKRNKPLWEAISATLQQKGFNRTPEQCKSKWKNLVTRFKGIEAMEGEGSRQFPFHEDMRTIFSERMERLMVSNKDKGKGVQVQGDEWGEEVVEEVGEEEEEEKVVGSRKKKRKLERRRGFEEEVENALKEFARRQLEIQARWMAAAEAREAERRAKEEEWRRTMVALEEERKAMERTLREREEQRRAREDARAERRDALLSAFLAKLEKEARVVVL